MELSFNDIFKEIIKECNPFIIEYSHKTGGFKDVATISYKIISVNGCNNPEQFKDRLTEHINNSIKKLRTQIRDFHKEKSLCNLNNIKKDLIELKYLVYNEIEVIDENEFGPREEINFKAFYDPKYIGTLDDKIHFYKTSILKYAELYAEVWEESINDAKNKIEFLINNLELTYDYEESHINIYVDRLRINELEKLSSKEFDFTRLIQLCKELNDASKNENFYSIIYLVRAIIDHIPPVFNKESFKEVASNVGSKSFKGSMRNLDQSSRKIADSALHQHIRSKETLPSKVQVNFSSDLDVLLSEIIRNLK